ncbi:hypothetical protein JCM16303_001075 [Sporobolomyces ruberrimus]
MESSNPNASSSSSSNQPPPPLSGYSNASPYSNQQRSTLQSYYSANQPGGGPSSAFHLAQQPHLAPQQQQRPLYPSHQYSNVYGQPPPPPQQQQQQLHSHLQQSHYAPYPYPFPQPHPHHPHAHPLSLPPQQHHPHPSHPQFQSYQPYGYPPPNYPPPPSNNPNQGGFPPPSNPYYLPPQPQQQQQQQYRAPPLSSSQQQGGGGQRLNSRGGGGGVVQNLLPDPSASAAAAALVGLPSTNHNTSSSSGGGPNSGGGLDAFGLPIPPAHYSTTSSSSTQQPYHPLSQPPPPSQLQHSLQHSRSHSHPHSQLSPFLGGPPPSTATSRSPSATSHQSKLVPPPPSNVPKPIHQHPLSHPPHPPHPHPSNSSTFVTVPSSSSSAPIPNSTKPTTKSKVVEKEKKKEKEKEKNVVEVVPERRSTRPRARTSYKPQYVDSDFDSSDEEDEAEEEEETSDEDHDDRFGSFTKGRGGNRKGNGNAKEDVYGEENEEVGNGVGKNGSGKGAVVGARYEQDEVTLGENGLMGELDYSEQKIEQGPEGEQEENLHGKGKGKGRNAKASPNKKGKGKAVDPVPTTARGKKRTRSESIVEPEQEEEEEYDESGEREEGEQYYDDQNEGEDGRDGGGDPEGDDKRKSARGGWGGAAGSRPDTFLTKLWKMLHGDPIDVKEYLRWDKTGRLLLIPDEKEFVERVCKVYFSQKSITSFNKQMNNWDFKRHSRSQRDLNKLKKHNPDITRETRIWYHTSLHSRSTWDDVANVARHEDGMAKKRRVRSKKTGVEEKAAPRRGRPKGSGGPLKIPGMLSSESEGEEMDEDMEDEGSVEERKPAPTSKRTRASPVKRNARDVEGNEDKSPARKKRRDGPVSAGSVSMSPAQSSRSTKAPSQLDDPASLLPVPPHRPSVFDPVPAAKTKSPDEEATDVDAPGEADEEDSVTHRQPEGSIPSNQPLNDDEEDAEGEIDAEGVADDDTETKEDQLEQDSEKHEQPPVSTGGRQTRASRGLRGLELSSINTTTSARGRGGGRGKKANAGLSKEGDDITPEKRDAIAGDDAEGVPNENAPSAPDEDEAQGPGRDRTNGQNPDAFDIIRQEAPRPKSRGGGWYLPARVADGKSSDGLEQQPRASEDMRRGGAGFPLSEEGSSSAVYALPRPPHLSTLPEVSSPSTSQPPVEPLRSASQPPPHQEPVEKSFPRGPALQVTPPAVHHPQDAPNPYFSDPGQERPPYHSDASGEPAPPRPYIHPAHAVPEELFVPGVTPQTDENQRPIVHYPVPTSSEQEQERVQERKEARISRGGDGDFEAQYAKLEAFVSGEGVTEGERGVAVAGTEDSRDHSHQPQPGDENDPHAPAPQ